MSPGAWVTAIASRLREGQRGVEPERRARLLHRLVDDADDRLGVLAARDLGYDATEARVEVDLAGDHVGEQLAPAPHDGGGGLVARRLDREDELVGIALQRLHPARPPSRSPHMITASWPCP